jgi:DNA-binding winged helix-turn-helix (wHTH) protein
MDGILIRLLKYRNLLMSYNPNHEPALITPATESEIAVEGLRVILFPEDLIPVTPRYEIADGRIYCEDNLRMITVDGSKQRLSRVQSELLSILSSNAGAIVTQDILIRRVWEVSTVTKDDTNNLKAHLWALRKKIGGEHRDANTGAIRTVDRLGLIAMKSLSSVVGYPQN